MSVEALKDVHKGRLCFIYGAGPSLHFADVSLLKDFVGIAVNSGLVKVPWVDYFISDDQAMREWDYYMELLPTLDCTNLLYRKKLRERCSHLQNVVLFDHTWWYDPKANTYNPEGIVLRKDEPLIGAPTSAGSAVHMAYLMGCNPVVLLGCDCNYKDGKRYFWQYPGETRPKRLPPYKAPASDNYCKRHYTGIISQFWRSFSSANKRIFKKEMKIIDASNSPLNLFPKMTVEEVLQEYGDRRK